MNGRDLIKANSFFWVSLLIFSALGVAAILLATINFGVGVSTDSTIYLSVATQIIQGETVETVIFPPLYPALLALLSTLFQSSLLDTARMLNAGLFGLTVLMSGILYRRYLKSSPIFLFFGIMTVLLSTPLFPVFLMVWSEPPFIFFATLFLLFFDRYLQDKKFIYLALSALFVAISSFTRYAGVAFILVGIINLLLANKNRLKKTILDSLSFAIIASLPITLWLIRNKFISGTFTGPRSPSAHSYSENIQALVNALLGWYIPNRAEMDRFLLAGIFLGLGVWIGIYYIVEWKKNQPDCAWQYPFVINILVYLIFLLATSSTYHQLIDSRYLAPILIPLNLLLIFYLHELSKIWSATKNWVLKGLLILLIAMFIAVPFNRTRNTFYIQRELGSEYTSRKWRGSETISAVQDLVSECVIYTNGVDAIEFFTAKQVKHMPFTDRPIEEAALESVLHAWPTEEKACLVWFENLAWRDYYYTPQELLEFLTVEKETLLTDGTIYYVSKNKP